MKLPFQSQSSVSIMIRMLWMYGKLLISNRHSIQYTFLRCVQSHWINVVVKNFVFVECKRNVVWLNTINASDACKDEGINGWKCISNAIIFRICFPIFTNHQKTIFTNKFFTVMIWPWLGFTTFDLMIRYSILFCSSVCFLSRFWWIPIIGRIYVHSHYQTLW